MPAGGPGRFEQAYNAQAAVEIESRLIVGVHVTQATNDKAQLGPTVAAIAPVVTSVKEVLVDSGFVSEAAITRLETDAAGRPTGLTVLAAVKREPHGRTVTQLERGLRFIQWTKAGRRLVCDDYCLGGPLILDCRPQRDRTQRKQQ